MKHSLSVAAVLLLLGTLLSACGSTPSSNYYLLSAQPVTAASTDGPAIGIGPVSVAQYLNRDSLVYNRDGNTLHIASFERWAEPLEDGIKRVIALNLAGLLDTENIQSFPWRRDQQPQYAVKVELLQLDANATSAELVAEWSVVRSADRHVLARRLSHLQQAMPAGESTPGDIPATYSSLLYRLSERIADEIRAVGSGRAQPL